MALALENIPADPIADMPVRQDQFDVYRSRSTAFSRPGQLKGDIQFQRVRIANRLQHCIIGGCITLFSSVVFESGGYTYSLKALDRRIDPVEQGPPLHGSFIKASCRR